MYAYAQCYLDDAMKNLGEAVEYAVCRCSLLPDRFMEMFIAGGLADGFEKGSPRYVSGMSGTSSPVISGNADFDSGTSSVFCL